MTRSEKHCEVNRSTSLLEESTRSDAARSSSIDRRNFQIVATVQHLTRNVNQIDMPVLGLAGRHFRNLHGKNESRYVDPASQIDITECHSRFGWLQNYDIPCSPLHRNK